MEFKHECVGILHHPENNGEIILGFVTSVSKIVRVCVCEIFFKLWAKKNSFVSYLIKKSFVNWGKFEKILTFCKNIAQSSFTHTLILLITRHDVI